MIHNVLGFAWLSLYARFVDRLRSALTRPVVKAWLERVTGGALVRWALGSRGTADDARARIALALAALAVAAPRAAAATAAPCSRSTRRTARICSSTTRRASRRRIPTVDVQWVDMGSQEVLDRLRAEKANPQADLWFGAPSEIFGRAAGEGLLDPYTPTWADKVPAEAQRCAGALVRDVHDARGDRVQHARRERRRRAEGLGRGRRSEVEGEGAHPESRRVGNDARHLRRDARALDRADRLDGAGVGLAAQARREHEGVRAQPRAAVPEARARGRGDHAVQHARHRDARGADEDAGRVRASRRAARRCSSTRSRSCTAGSSRRWRRSSTSTSRRRRRSGMRR